MLTQFQKTVPSLISAVGELKILKVVNLLVIVAPIGIDELVVVRLAQVQYTSELTVDILRHLYRTLHININTRALYDAGHRRVLKAAVSVVAAITYKQGFVTDIGLLREEGIVQVVQSVEDLIRLQFE